MEKKARRGRKFLSEGKTARILVLLPESLLTDLEAAALAAGMNRQELVREAITAWIERSRKEASRSAR